MSFTQFNFEPSIEKAISLCGYTEPTPVQEKAIPHILEGVDLVATAQTGTGKTAAFVLPLLHKLSTQASSKKTRVLILTPTRELATQISKGIQTYGKFLRLNSASLVGGMSYHTQIKDLSRGADIIIATPGRLMDHIEQNRVNLSGIETLVLDEADRMLDMGFIDDVRYIAKLTPSQRQTLLFSATMDKALGDIIKQLLKNPVRVDLSAEKVAAPKIEQIFYKTTSIHHKSRLLRQILTEENIFKSIIFTATKRHADQLSDELADDGFSAMPLHGDLRQATRTRTLEQLRSGKIQYIVATDVAARGIDVSDITHVINFDLPKHTEDYVHRIGRTGRAGKTGKAISFVSPQDSHTFKHIERYLGQRIKLNFPEDSAPSSSREKDDFATKKKKAEEKKRYNVKPAFKKDERSTSTRSKRSPNLSDQDDSHVENMLRDLEKLEKVTQKDSGVRFKSREDRPARASGDRFGKSEDRPRREGSERFKSREDRPRREGGERFKSREDRPRREGSDRFKSREDRPARSGNRFGSSEDRPRREGSDRFKSREDRPRREGSDRFKTREDRPRREGGERFKNRENRPTGDRFRSREDSPRREGGDRFKSREDRPARSGNRFSSSEDRPRREGGDRFKSREDRPARSGNRFGSSEDRPRRESGDRFKSREDRPRREGGDRFKNRDDKPTTRGAHPRSRKVPSNAWRADAPQTEERPSKFAGKKKSFGKKKRS